MAILISSFHSLLILSDSALPLGSFAFSSGLESFLAHHRYFDASAKVQAFQKFLENSISNLASTALPYALTAHQDPSRLVELDNDFDASTPCTVARRTSVSQGRALLTIWEKALFSSVAPDSRTEDAVRALTSFVPTLKSSKPDNFGTQLNGHFAPVFGTVCKALGLALEETAYLFLLNHSKALLSAAVRASVIGSYQSQAILASGQLQEAIHAAIARNKDGKIEDAAVTVPVMDLWMGRHELLYSRIFNS